MLFNSISFLIFFPIVTALYFACPYERRWILLLAASCAFYMAFIPAYIAILAFTIIVDYVAGLLIAGAVGVRRRAWLALSIVANVGVLAVFKYYNFARENLETLALAVGGSAHLPVLRMLLPIGLSFHTFQAMSYTIEVYRGKQQPERHFGIYALYVMFYPQLVAGPIERPQNLLWQFREKFDFDYDRIVAGLQRMTWGMLKKVVVADRLALEVDRVYTHPHQFHGLALLLATFFFTFQIYYDFSGYSDIALGAAEVMGFRLMRNFRTPYFSTSLAEFWTRWHISLSTWFRDYLYIPLGGNRVSFGRNLLNLLIVFLVSGLWHGASWTFVIWGAIHGGMMIVERLTAPLHKRVGDALGMSSRSRAAVGWGTTFLIAFVAWIFFRASNLSDATYVTTHLFTGIGGDLHAVIARSPSLEFSIGGTMGRLALIAMLVSLELVDDKKGLFRILRAQKPAIRYAAYFSLVYACVIFNATQHQFVYFQF